MQILSAAYFGSIAYFQELAKHKQVAIECKETFPKQSYRNRCDIVGANGIISLTIPVNRPNGSKSVIDTVQLLDDITWKNEHWRSIRSAYQSSPYFDHYESELHDLLYSDAKDLISFNIAITNRVLEWLNIETQIELTKEWTALTENDPRIKLLDKNENKTVEPSPYIQVFNFAGSYYKGLSILDTIMCLGPVARNLIVPR